MKRAVSFVFALALATLAVTPAQAVITSCYTICQNDLKACRNSCHTLTCYQACQAGYDSCYAGCSS